MQEKRKHPRIKDKLVVLCEIPEGGKLEDVEHSHDISEGGIKITIPKSAVKGDTVTCKINLFNDAIPVSVKGRIAWKREQGKRKDKDVAGVEFGGTDASEGKRLKNYINRKLKNSKEGK